MQKRRWVAAVCTRVVTLAGSSGAREGNVLHVPGDYPTIQAAVDAAHPGDHVRVAAGVYNENVVVTTTDLRLEASEGAVIDGSGLSGPGVHLMGTATERLSGVRVAGFEVRGFDQGIVASLADGVWIHRNDIHSNVDKVAPFAGLTDGIGVDLRTVRFSRVSGNLVHGNGGNGIAVRIGSTHNSIRANRISGNALQSLQSPEGMGAGLVVTGPSSHNELLENEVVANYGWGIWLTRPAGLALSGILVAQNRSHENVRAGIAIMGSAVSDNTILQNNATGNQTGGLTDSPCWPFDLFDDAPVNNTFARNQGAASPGLD